MGALELSGLPVVLPDGDDMLPALVELLFMPPALESVDDGALYVPEPVPVAPALALGDALSVGVEGVDIVPDVPPESDDPVLLFCAYT